MRPNIREIPNAISSFTEEKTPIYLCPGSTMTLVRKVINANTIGHNGLIF